MKPPLPANKTVPKVDYGTTVSAAVAPIIHLTMLLAFPVINRGGSYVYEEQRVHVS